MPLGIEAGSHTFLRNTPESTWSVTNAEYHNHGTDPDGCFVVTLHESIIPNIVFEVLDRTGWATTRRHRHRNSNAFENILQQSDVGFGQAIQVLNLYLLTAVTAREF
jgi:hypothetical protein